MDPMTKERSPGNQVRPTQAPDPGKAEKKNAKALKIELSKTYRKWLDEDVRWIITDQERSAFMQLSNDEERDQFIEAFWQRRDPTPDTEENEYKEEHYRRIAYANEHYAAGIPGWKTDRGHMYIVFGPPDEIDSHPSGGSYERPMEEGGGETSTFPFETMALSLHRGDRAGSDHRVRRYLHVQRLSHDVGPLGKGRVESTPRMPV
jgi:GWxTD domain-containing protein